MFTVVSTIISPNLDAGNEVEVTWYTGDNLAQAIASAAQAAVTYDDDATVPEQFRPITKSVRIDFA